MSVVNGQSRALPIRDCLSPPQRNGKLKKFIGEHDEDQSAQQYPLAPCEEGTDAPLKIMVVLSSDLDTCIFRMHAADGCVLAAMFLKCLHLMSPQRERARPLGHALFFALYF